MIPPFEEYFPYLMSFIAHLKEEALQGKLSTWDTVAAQVRSFFVSDIMDKMEATIPGWQHMASFEDGKTLIHVMLVFTALLLRPEYQSASEQQQAILKWSVLFHDLGKVVIDGKGDFVHAFRSATLVAQQLPRFGFATCAEYASLIGAWSTLTINATTLNPRSNKVVQDNRQLPQILNGIEQLFGYNTHATLIVKTVLFHMSINVVTAWPQAAPLTDAESRQYINPALFPLLKIMMLIDSDAWDFFSPAIQKQNNREMLATFSHLYDLITHR